jgi:hypothetical protein
MAKVKIKKIVWKDHKSEIIKMYCDQNLGTSEIARKFTKKYKREVLPSTIASVIKRFRQRLTVSEREVLEKKKPEWFEAKQGAKPIKVDYEEEARLLLEWADKEDSDHLAKFTLCRGTYAAKLWEWRDSSDRFAEALKIAKDKINIRIRDKFCDPNKNYHPMLAMRDITAHDVLLKGEERNDKKFEADLKLKQAEAEVMTAAKLAQLAASGELSQK